MKMAKASQQEIDIVRDFFQMLDEIQQYGAYTPEEDCEEIIVVTPDKIGELVEQKMPDVLDSWSRVVHGFEVLLLNCCDPDANTLEWKDSIADRDLLSRAFVAGIARWEWFEPRSKKGELCTNGMRYTCEVDEGGVPVLGSHLRAVLERQLGKTGG